MKFPQLVLVICATQWMLRMGSALCAEAPSVEEVEKKAISYRLENTKQGYVRMHVIDEMPHSECLFDITFDEHRIRHIRRCRQGENSPWKGPEKIIVTPNRYITDDEETDVPVVVQIAPATDYKSPREHFRLLNVQALGMCTNGTATLHVDHVESLMHRSDRIALAVHADVRDGIDTWRIDYEMKHPQKNWRAKFSLWIAPSQGFSVVGIYHQADQDGKLYSTTVNTQMKQYLEKNVWYPYKLVKILKDGDRIIHRQVVTVEEARFGGPIEETAFTPAGLDLKPGREVVDSMSGQPWLNVWDGKELVKSSSVKTAPANPARHRRPRWLLLTLAASLGLMAFFYFWRVIKQRRSGSNPGP